MAKPPLMNDFIAYLIENQAIYQGLFAESPNAYVVLTPDIKIVNANDAYLSLAQKNREQLVGEYLFDVFPANPIAGNTGPANLRALFDRMRTSQAREILSPYRYDIQNQDGAWEERHWHTVNWPIVDDGGALIAVIHHVSEVTEQTQLARMLAEARLEIQRARQNRNELERLLAQTKKTRRRKRSSSIPLRPGFDEVVRMLGAARTQTEPTSPASPPLAYWPLLGLTYPMGY